MRAYILTLEQKMTLARVYNADSGTLINDAQRAALQAIYMAAPNRVSRRDYVADAWYAERCAASGLALENAVESLGYPHIVRDSICGIFYNFPHDTAPITVADYTAPSVEWLPAFTLTPSERAYLAKRA